MTHEHNIFFFFFSSRSVDASTGFFHLTDGFQCRSTSGEEAKARMSGVGTMHVDRIPVTYKHHVYAKTVFVLCKFRFTVISIDEDL